MDFIATPRASRRYFPMLLANGRDAVLADYSGSMMTGSPHHAHHEQNQGILCGWYKIAHRAKRTESIVPVIQYGYFMICNGEPYEPEDYEQSFNPEDAILTTRIIASGFKVVIESFLRCDSVLTEHYKVLEVPDGNSSLEFFVVPPNHGLYPLVLPTQLEMKTTGHQESGLIEGNYRLRGIKGSVFSGCDCVPDRVSEDRFSFTEIKAGFETTRYLLVLDETDHKAYRKTSRERFTGLRAKSYRQNRSQHSKTWNRFCNKSAVSVPNEDIQYLYDLGIYTLKAHQYPATGGITVGMYPPLWGGGGMFGYDSYYLQQALLRTNHVEQSRELIDFWKLCSRQARVFAHELGKPGFFFPWCSFTPLGGGNDGSKEQRIFEKRLDTAAIALEVLRHHESTGDLAELEGYWDLVKGCLDFLLAESVVELDDEVVIKPMEGANESTAVSNDSFTVLVLIKVLELTILAAPSIGKKVPNNYPSLLEKLRAGLAKNCPDGVFMPFRGASEPGCLPLMAAVWNLPDGMNYRSIKASLEQTKTPWGISSGLRTQRYRDWPWFHFRAAIALAFLNKKNAPTYLYSGTKYNSALGAFPEKIRMDDYAIGYWYSTVHALFVFGLNCLLVNEADNQVNIFHHIPRQWKNVAFSNLRVPPGLLVSAELKQGRVVTAEIKNDTRKPIETTVSVPCRLLSEKASAGYRRFAVRILSGRKTIVIGSPKAARAK